MDSLGILTFFDLTLDGLTIGHKFSCIKTNFIEKFLYTNPHDTFEISAIIIAGAASFKIPYEIVCYLAGKKEQPLMKEDRM